MGPPKNTRFVFFTNNRGEAKGNTLDCTAMFIFPCPDIMKPKPLRNHICTLMYLSVISYS